ncbi:MAG: VWA domain-containing protein [Phycisphaerales bacterium]|nr:VWA domain-containing protein [Phycisphaerales bacterium]
MNAIPLQFEQPLALILSLLLIPVALLAWRSRRSEGIAKWWTALTLRTIVVICLVGALSQPSLTRRGEAITTVFVLDDSRSIPLALRQQARAYAKELVDGKPEDEDRVAAITLGREASIAAQPDAHSIVPTEEHTGSRDATDIGAGIRQALSIMPPDTARRIVLFSDGNENVGDAIAEARLAFASGIPVDVVPLEYEFKNEVVFEGIRAPSRARLGQTADLRLTLRSQAATSGRLTLSESGRPIDLSPDEVGDARMIELPAGATAIIVPIPFDASGARRFEAVFEPIDADADAQLENNRATAVTFVGGEGEVLIVDEGGVESGPLREALIDSGIVVRTVGPGELAKGADFLGGFDAVVLANVARWNIDGETDRLLRAYVHDLGGGLLMLGGDQSFGAGGWIGSETAQALPVKLDPPATRQMVRGALVCVVHSCEMPQGNYWAQQVTIAAVEALSRLDLIGIITWTTGPTWALPLQEAGDKSKAVAAARSMVVGDMMDFDGTVQMAVKALSESRAGQRHMIIVSDGDPSPPTKQTLRGAIEAKVTITTVMVAGHGTPQDNQNMKFTADATGGNFYEVKNPKNLPKIFIKEAQMVARSLIVEGDFQPTVVSSTSGPTRGFSAVAPIGGYVLTIPRDGLASVRIYNVTQEGTDPIFADWNFGLGRSAVFTSDIAGRWGKAWVAWSDFKPFWEQTVRWLMRPPTPQNLALRTHVDGDRAIVELEALSAAGGFATDVQPESVIIAPDGALTELALQQVGPGRWRGEFVVEEAGSYLVNVSANAPSTSAGSDSNARRGSVQASVSVPYPKEFRTVRDNSALLESVANETGGRVIRLGDLGFASAGGAFEKGDLPIPESAKRIWDLLAIIAAICFVFDVAVRRLTFDADAARAHLRGAITPIGASGEATVVAWKKARARSGTARAVATTEAADPLLGRMGPALDTRAEAANAGDSNARGNAQPTSATTSSSADATDVPEETPMERLLRARKRAQGEERIDGEGDGRG